MHYPSNVGGRQGYSTATYPQALPREDSLDRLGKLTAIQDQDQNSMMGMLHSLYGISGDMQLRPEHLRELQLKNDALSQENAWAQPNAEQNYNLKGAQIGRLNAETDAQKEQEPDLNKLWMGVQMGYLKPEDVMATLGNSKVYKPAYDSYHARLTSENAAKAKAVADEEARTHPTLPASSQPLPIPPQYANDPAFVKEGQDYARHEQNPGIFDMPSPEQQQRQQALEAVRRQTHPVIQGLKDLWGHAADLTNFGSTDDDILNQALKLNRPAK